LPYAETHLLCEKDEIMSTSRLLSRWIPARRKNTIRRRKRLNLEPLEARVVLTGMFGPFTQQALIDFHGPDLQGKDGPMSDVDLSLLSLYHEYQSYLDNGAKAPFVPSNSLVNIVKDRVVVDLIADAVPMGGDQSAGAGSYEAEVISDGTTQLADDLRELGAEITGTWGHVVSALLPISAIPQVAGMSALQSASASAMMTNAGLVTSQGDPAMRSDVARAVNENDGEGITVGVLSDSYNSLGDAATDVANGDLPPGVVVLEDSFGSDEGRAMMQLITDVAPGAGQAFHTANFGQANFADGILRLANEANADVIVDDIIYFAEPMFQDGIIAQAADQVVADGVAYFSAAGNQSRLAYEGEVRITGELDPFTGSPQHDFDPGAGIDVFQEINVPVGSGFVMAFQWDSPFASASPGSGGSTNDLDIIVYDSTETIALAGGIAGNLGGDAVEVFSFVNFGGFGDTFNISISKFAGDDPGYLKYVMFPFADVDIVEFDTQSGTTYGHAFAAGAESVGAAFYGDTPEFGVDPPIVEPFSSAGGSPTGLVTPIFFDTDGNRLATPEIRDDKPGIVAPDNTNTTFFVSGFDIEPDGFPNFPGTSAAAPHAAGVAALMLSSAGGSGSLTPTEVYTTLRDTAIDMDDPDTPGFDIGFDFATGFGFVDAEAAVGAVALPPLPVVPFPTPLEGVEPDGSLIYEGSISKNIDFEGDTDGYTVEVDPGQTITVVVDGSPSLLATAELFVRGDEEDGDDWTPVAFDTADELGGYAVIQTVVTRGQIAGGGPGPQTYLLQVSGADESTGGYTAQIILNSAVEDESYGGAANDEQLAAQDIEGSFLPLLSAISDEDNEEAGRQPERGAVLGTTDLAPGGFADEVEPNQPPVTVPDLAGNGQNVNDSGWNLDENPIITDSTTIPHISIEGTGDGTFDYYVFDVVAAGSRGIFDIDLENFDTELFLYDTNGNLLAANDDNGSDPGSGSGLASLIDFTFAQAGTYIIGVGEFNSFNFGGEIDGNAPDPGDFYTLHISLENTLLNPGGADPVAEVEPNQPPPPTPPDLAAFAQDINGEVFNRNPDPFIESADTIPHLSIDGTGDGTFDYYVFDVSAPGSRGIFDIDFENFDTELFLYDTDGNLLAFNDDNGSDPGSGSGLASLIDYTFAQPGTYIIGVGEFNSFDAGGQIGGNTPDPGDFYTLHVSLENRESAESQPDWYSFDLKQGTSATIAATALTEGHLGLELYDAAGNLVAQGIPDAEPEPTNVNDLISNFVAPTTGTYYTQVTGTPATDYSLVVTRSADFSIEDNNDFESAQPIISTAAAGRQWVLGALSSDTVAVEAFDTGWYQEAGLHDPTNTNYFTGFFPGFGELRSFFAFDLSGIGGASQVTSARFDVFSALVANTDPFETLIVSEVTTPVDEVVAGGTDRVDIFEDLGTGTLYGSRDIQFFEDNVLLEIGLNDDAVSALNAALGQQFALGGALTTIDFTGPQQNVFGNSSGAFTQQLVLDVVEADYYSISADGNSRLIIETATPADKSGEFVNDLDPVVLLYDADGNLVDWDDDGASDRRNARLSYKVPKNEGGTYFIVVASSDATATASSGEYILSVQGNTDEVGGDDLRIEPQDHAAAAVSQGLTREALAPFVEEAVAYWRDNGADQADLGTLSRAEIYVTDLPGPRLGTAYSNGRVYIDTDAAGYGWLLDAERSLGGVDLVHTLTHELGHVIGFEHHDADHHDVMAATLAPTLPMGSSFSSLTPLLSLSELTDGLSLSADRQEVGFAIDAPEPATAIDTPSADVVLLPEETPKAEVVQDGFWAGFGVEDDHDDESDEDDLLTLLAHRLALQKTSDNSPT
jgi:hypothetical protein